MTRRIFATFAILATAATAGTPATIIDLRKSVAPSMKECSFEVPAFSVEHQVRLSLEARIECGRLSGSNHWLRVAVNDTYLTKPDLLNKRNEFSIRGGLDLLWVKGDRWRVLYSPDFEAAVTQRDNSYACPDADPYRFVWDITRYVQPGANSLRIHHLKVLAKPSTLVLRNVEVEAGKPMSPPTDETVAPAPTGPLPTFVARGPQRVPMHVSLSPTGGIGLRVAGCALGVQTRTSLPPAQWYETQPGDAINAEPCKVATATWVTSNYRVERMVRARADHVHVTDKFTNVTGELVGVMVEHRLQSAEKPAQIRLAGRLAFGEKTRAMNAGHPSVFAKWRGIGVGLVAEDDVFRVHAMSFRQPDGLGLMDDRLGLAPKSSIALEWSIYPVPGGDYWDFVNAVRHNWDTNFAIPGPFCFVSGYRTKKWSAQQWGDWMRARGLKMTCGGIATYPDRKYAHGTGIEHAPAWVDREADWTNKIHETAPEVKIFAYFHAQCCTEPSSLEKYADSRLIDTKAWHVNYPYRYPLPLYLPTRDNSYGRALWGFVRTCLHKIGVDGIYWDEMSHSVLHYAEDAPWDGCSVRIDRKTHEALGKLTSVPLIMQQLKLDIIKHLRERGKLLMANTQPATRTMTQQKILRFVETGSYSAVANTHLGCPLALGNHHQEKTHADATRNVRRILEYGGIYCGHYYYRDPAPWNFMDVMYPITPVELRKGVVLGHERIHTARSGRFGWPDGSRADVYVVDSDGARVTAGMVKEVTEDGRRLYEIRMPSDHFAVLVRRQATE